MTKRTKRSIVSAENVAKRWHTSSLHDSGNSTTFDFSINTLNESLNESLNDEDISFELTPNDKSCQTDFEFFHKSKSTQTSQFSQLTRLSMSITHRVVRKWRIQTVFYFLIKRNKKV